MEIGEFRKQFMEQLRFDAEHEGSALRRSLSAEHWNFWKI